MVLLPGEQETVGRGRDAFRRVGVLGLGVGEVSGWCQQAAQSEREWFEEHPPRREVGRDKSYIREEVTCIKKTDPGEIASFQGKKGVKSEKLSELRDIKEAARSKF